MGDGPSDTRRFLLILFGAVWLMSFIYAFYALATVLEAAPSGLTNVGVYLGWQGVAGIAAVAIYGVGLAWEKGSGARKLTQVPILLAILHVLGLIAVFFA